ncbi:hypothetical protein RhiJN_25867 [Ceratobasidium sp. AG-Ba]|nr:hypothetical protein RhiJN_25867 [Ceratobasidium sp. AG-Ba]
MRDSAGIPAFSLQVRARAPVEGLTPRIPGAGAGIRQNSRATSLPKPTLATGSVYQDYQVPTCFGSEDPSASNQPKQEPASEDNERQRLARPSSPSERSVMEFDPYGTSTLAARGRVAFESAAATQTQAAASCHELRT